MLWAKLKTNNGRRGPTAGVVLALQSLGIPGFPPGMPYGFVRIFYFYFFYLFIFSSSAAKVSG